MVKLTHCALPASRGRDIFMELFDKHFEKCLVYFTSVRAVFSKICWCSNDVDKDWFGCLGRVEM